MIRSIIGIALLVLILYGTTAYGETIKYSAKKLLHIPEGQVQGVHTEDVTQRLKSEAASGAAAAQKQVMQLKVSDVLNFIGRAQKIGTDITHVGGFIASQTGELTKKK